ncbi:hypothetical protein PWT90_08603 [Aphanocladium album]|nr:hypothetical protein PWT90_08603 [Aphanocladium album]
MLGYSGGGSVTYDTIRVQPDYGPEYGIAGAALGGISTSKAAIDPVVTFRFFNKSRRATYIPVILLALASQVPEFDALLRKHPKPEYHDHFFSATSQRLEAKLNAFQDQDILGMFEGTQFISHGSKFADLPAVPDIAPQIPLFWFQLRKDEISTTGPVSRSVSDLCAKGSQTQFEVETSHKFAHASYSLIGASHAFKWLDKAMNGQVANQGCSRRNVLTTEMDPEFLDLYSPQVQLYLQLILAGKLI